MSQYFEIHPHNPQQRLLRRAVDILSNGGVIVYPTDSCYALGCHIGDKAGVDRIRRLRGVDEQHHMTLVCRDLSELGTYAKVDNPAYRMLKAMTPGPYTFILQATREVPRRLQHPKRKTIGLRVPDHVVAQALLAQLGSPLISTTLVLPGDDAPMTEASTIRDVLGSEVDLIISGGNCGLQPTTVVDLVDGTPQVLRWGKGEAQVLET